MIGPEYSVKTSAKGAVFIVSSTTEAHWVERVRVRYVKGTGNIIGRITDRGIAPASNQDVFDNAEFEILKRRNDSPIPLRQRNQKQSSKRKKGSRKKKRHSRERKEESYRHRLRSRRDESKEARVYLRESGIRRHTFMWLITLWKNIRLGVYLSSCWLSDDCPHIIIIDPNSDFVKLDKRVDFATYNTRVTRPLSKKDFTDLLQALRSGMFS